MKKNETAMRNLPKEIRPYERAQALGEGHLSDAELLAVLLRSGTTEQSSLELAEDMLKRFGGLKRLSRAALKKLTAVNGVGRVKAITIKCAFELGKRIARERRVAGAQIVHVRQLAALYMAEMDTPQEQVRMVMLDIKSRIIGDVEISRGSADRAVVDPKMIFSAALESGACSIILMHNHPTGDLTPSEEDYRMTDRIQSAGRLLGILVPDHVIFGDGRYYSFFENGDLPKIRGISERAG